MTRFSRTICVFAVYFLASGAQAVPTDTDITGELSKAENTCVSPIAIFTSNPPQLCSYSGGEDVAIAVGLGQFKRWMGPLDSGGFYATGEGPDPLITEGSAPGDGKVNLPITGTITIEDNNTPGAGNGGDDSISGTLVIGAGERSVLTSDGTAIESFDSITHVIPVRVVDFATDNALGGYDYVIGTAGFPLLLQSGLGMDDYPSEVASEASGSSSPPDFNTWDQANGGNVPVVNMPFPAGPPPTSQGPYTVEVVTYAPANGNVGPNVGVATIAVIVNHVCVSGDGAGNPIPDCDPNPDVGSPTTWVHTGAEFDNLIIRLSTDANNNVVSADAFYAIEYKILSLFANGRTKPGSYIGGTLSLVAITGGGGDDDNDGVPNDVDACPMTVTGETVNADGCSVADLCPCDNGWKNYGTYVSCVAHASNDMKKAGLISGAEQGALVSAAAQSSCGARK
jgi:hypothetical protein